MPIADRLEEHLQADDRGTRVGDCLAGQQGVDEGAIEVIDLDPDGVLILGLQDRVGPLRDPRPGRDLAGQVERVLDVQVVLDRPAGTT